MYWQIAQSDQLTKSASPSVGNSFKNKRKKETNFQQSYRGALLAHRVSSKYPRKKEKQYNLFKYLRTIRIWSCSYAISTAAFITAKLLQLVGGFLCILGVYSSQFLTQFYQAFFRQYHSALELNLHSSFLILNYIFVTLFSFYDKYPHHNCLF